MTYYMPLMWCTWKTSTLHRCCIKCGDPIHCLFDEPIFLSPRTTSDGVPNLTELNMLRLPNGVAAVHWPSRAFGASSTSHVPKFFYLFIFWFFPPKNPPQKNANCYSIKSPRSRYVPGLRQRGQWHTTRRNFPTMRPMVNTTRLQ